MNEISRPKRRFKEYEKMPKLDRSEYQMEYRLNHKAEQHEYYLLHKTERCERQREYDLLHKEERAEYHRKWQLCHKESLRENSRNYYLSHKEQFRARAARRQRELGYNPLNTRFEGSVGHHITKDDVVFIPEEIHKSIPHNIFTGKNMPEINGAALVYVGKQG